MDPNYSFDEKMVTTGTIVAAIAIFFSVVAMILVVVLLFRRPHLSPTLQIQSPPSRALVTVRSVRGTETSPIRDTTQPNTDLYLVGSEVVSPITLTVTSKNIGQTLLIKNASNQMVTLVNGPGVAINPGGTTNGLIIAPGELAWLAFTRTGQALRLT